MATPRPNVPSLSRHDDPLVSCHLYFVVCLVPINSAQHVDKSQSQQALNVVVVTGQIGLLDDLLVSVGALMILIANPHLI